MDPTSSTNLPVAFEVRAEHQDLGHNATTHPRRQYGSNELLALRPPIETSTPSAQNQHVTNKMTKIWKSIQNSK